jgi:hypothetical protein
MSADDCRFIDGFPETHKIAMRFLMIAFITVGAYAVFLHNWVWGWIYVAVVVLGQALLVLPNLCGHCPYPHEHNDCLLMPAGLVRKLIPYGGPEIGKGGRLAMVMGGAGSVLIPQFWLFREPMLLFLFWAAFLPFLAYFMLYLCKRCRHTGCPANRVPKTELQV